MKLDELVNKLKSLSSVTVAPNCFQLIKKQELGKNCAIGEIRKAFYVLGADSEVLDYMAPENPKDLPLVDSRFLSMLENVFGCKIQLDEQSFVFAGEELKNCNSILVGFDSLFSDVAGACRSVYTITSDLEPRCAFYQILANGGGTVRCEAEKTYEEMIPLADLKEIYIPFISGDYSRFYIPIYETGLKDVYPLPALCGAEFTATYSDDNIRISTYDNKMYHALQCWRQICYKPGGVISHGWGDLARILEAMLHN